VFFIDSDVGCNPAKEKPGRVLVPLFLFGLASTGRAFIRDLNLVLSFENPPGYLIQQGISRKSVPIP
jgi:hypothetical protein